MSTTPNAARVEARRAAFLEEIPPDERAAQAARFREFDLVRASPLHGELSALIVALRQVRRMIDGTLGAHGEGCECHFCTSDFQEDTGCHFGTREIAEAMLDELTGFRWALQHALGMLEPEIGMLPDDDDTEDDADEPEADEAAFVAGPR
jgi:hypothetical protein